MVSLRQTIKIYRLYLLYSLLALMALVVVLALVLKKEFYQVSVGSCDFEAEVVTTAKAHYLGLSGRKSLDVDKGMLFLFDNKADHTFVMRDMNFPLDIIFISDNRVVNLYQDLPPEDTVTKMSYHSGAPVNAVLEVPAGSSRACGIGVGSQVKW
ncbi:MAG: DUF192 domain-containing protein [bacterium]|nr:DUF192 domain-containing protein [bacterium]